MKDEKGKERKEMNIKNGGISTYTHTRIYIYFFMFKCILKKLIHSTVTYGYIFAFILQRNKRNVRAPLPFGTDRFYFIKQRGRRFRYNL